MRSPPPTVSESDSAPERRLPAVVVVLRNGLPAGIRDVVLHNAVAIAQREGSACTALSTAPLVGRIL